MGNTNYVSMINNELLPAINFVTDPGGNRFINDLAVNTINFPRNNSQTISYYEGFSFFTVPTNGIGQSQNDSMFIGQGWTPSVPAPPIIGQDNLSWGWGAMGANGNSFSSEPSGSHNIALGYIALESLTSGQQNIGIGFGSGAFLTSGQANTSVGFQALDSDQTDNGNTAFGAQALHNAASGGNNIALGDNAGVNLSSGANNIYIGNPGASGGTESYMTYIGTTQTNTILSSYELVQATNSFLPAAIPGKVVWVNEGGTNWFITTIAISHIP